MSESQKKIDPSVITDEELVVLARGENRDLYAEIIRRYEHRLGHYLRKFIGDPDELEDVLQAVFIKAYQHLRGFNVSRKFSSWIYRIAHNEAVNHLRKNDRGIIPFDEMEFKLIDEKIDLDAQVDRQILERTFGLYLSRLKMKYREPLVLYYFENKSYQEISDILRLPVSTVGTLIRRGKEQLKNAIESAGRADNLSDTSSGLPLFRGA